jgi:TonB family protein
MKIKFGVVAGVAFFSLAAAWSHGQAPVADGAVPAASALPESDPMVKTWVPPVYPADLKAEGVTGNVTVHFIVDEKGAVSAVRAAKSSDPRFEAAAVESVKQWTFDPGVNEGVHAAMGMGVRLNFRLPEKKHGLVPPQESTPELLPKTDAKAESSPNPEYPADLLFRQIGGKGVVGFVVEPDGSISGLRLLGVSHPGFARPVLEAAKAMTFAPAKQGDLAVAAKIVSPMEFDPFVAKIDEITKPHLEVNGFEVRLAQDQRQRDLCDRAPVLWDVPDPVYPRGAALAGIEGEAVVEFNVDERGNPENLQLVSASVPEFGQVLMDTLVAGTFKPAMKDGRTVAVPLRWKYAFKQPAAEPAEGETPEDRLIRLLRAGGVVGTAKGLDAPLKPLWRVAPVYPAALRAEAAKGTAEVEFIIDREGRVRLPYAVKASQEPFGRAAVIAASLWVFDPPTRGGQAVDVRVRIPFQFSP